MTVLCATIPELPESVNQLYRKTPWGMRKSEKGKAFQNRCADVIRELLARRRFQALPPNCGWLLKIIFWLPSLETTAWEKKGDTHQRFVVRDVDNLAKLITDAVYQAISRDDSAGIKLIMEKRNGHGRGWVDLMLREVNVPSEYKNATELAQEINSRGNGIRASPSDPPALLEYLFEAQDNGAEYRFTPFDEWRLEIMDKILSIFDQVRGRLDCPAKTGDLNACFGCSDMMVIHCIMSNPQTIDVKGRRVGLFDLSCRKTGSYVGTVDRPGGKQMEEQKKTPTAWFLEVLSLAHHADEDPRLLGKAMKAVYETLRSMEDKDAPVSKEICLKLMVLLQDLIDAGVPHGPKRSVIFYRQINEGNLPEPFKKVIQEAGSPYHACIKLYRTYREMVVPWFENGGNKTDTEAKKKDETPKEKAKEPEPEPKPEAEPEPESEPEPEDEPEDKPEDEDEPKPESEPESEPEPEEGQPAPVKDASIEVQNQDGGPKVHTIEPKKGRGKARKEPSPEAPSEDRQEIIDLLNKVIEGQRKIAEGFNALLKYLQSQSK